MILNAFEEVEHPKGRIRLLDGRLLDAYPIVDEKKEEESQELFLQNAVYLYERRDAILQDSRMFLARVPIQNGLAYTGSDGFNDPTPTLGVYIEWWQTCKHSRLVIKRWKWFSGRVWRKSLLYHIAGSPLSGRNHCSAVAEDGKTHIVSVSPFKDVWVSFMRINNRYKEPKRMYDYYTLEQTINILRHGKENN